MDKETFTAVQVSIKTAEDKLAEMRKDIDTARKAGIDVAEHEKVYRDLSQKITLLKAAYK